jgi:hypothetical protein
MKPVEPPQEPSVLMDLVEEPGDEPAIAVQLPKAI